MPLLPKQKSKPARRYEPGDIVRIEALSNYCKIFFSDPGKPLVVSKVLHRVQEQLPADMFIRVHRSHVVNRLYIKQVSGSQTKTAELINGEFIPVSRRNHAVVA